MTESFVHSFKSSVSPLHVRLACTTAMLPHVIWTCHAPPAFYDTFLLPDAQLDYTQRSDCAPYALLQRLLLQSDMTEDNRRLSNTAIDILGHLPQDQGVEHQQLFSRDSVGAVYAVKAYSALQCTTESQRACWECHMCSLHCLRK